MRWEAPMRSALMIAWCFVFFAGASCNRAAKTSATPFPASNEVEGWVKTGDIRTFAAADLWKYVDADAERYLKAGVQTVSTADYKFKNKIDVVVDIYTMANAEGAAKIFESEPAADAKPVPLGDAARLYGQSLVFRKGPNLVRIVAYEESAETPRAILQLGGNIERRLAR